MRSCVIFSDIPAIPNDLAQRIGVKLIYPPDSGNRDKEPFDAVKDDIPYFNSVSELLKKRSY